MIGWSLVSWTQAWITGRATFYITRALIGAFEDGFIPGTILFATYFYKTRELSVRLAFFWSTLNVCSHLYIYVEVANLLKLIIICFYHRSPALSPPFSQQVFSRCEASRERPAGSGCSWSKDCSPSWSVLWCDFTIYPHWSYAFWHFAGLALFAQLFNKHQKLSYPHPLVHGTPGGDHG